MLATLAVTALLQGLPTDAGAIARGAAEAAERGTMRTWLAPWLDRARRTPKDRLAIFAKGAAAWHLYQLREADSLFQVLLPGTSATDDVARQALLGRARIMVARGHTLDAVRQLATVQAGALSAGDTVTALDALLLRAGLIRRSQPGNDAGALLDSAVTLGALRVPRLAAVVQCRRAGAAGIRADIVTMRREAQLGIASARTAGSQRLEAACHFVRATSFVRVGATDSFRYAIDTAMLLQRRSGDLAAIAAAQQWRGFYATSLGNHHVAQRYLAAAWTDALASGVVDAQAWTALSRAGLAEGLNDVGARRRWLDIADSLMTRSSDEAGRREVLRMRAASSLAVGDSATGRRQLDEVLKRAREASDVSAIHNALVGKLRVAINAGDLPGAYAAQQDLEEYARAQRLSGYEASGKVLAGEVALLARQYGEAVLAFDEALRRISPLQHSFRHSVHVMRAVALARMGRISDAATDSRAAEEAHDRWRASISDSALRLHTTTSWRNGPSYLTELVSLLAASGRMESAVRLAESQRARRLREQLADAVDWAERSSGGAIASDAPDELVAIQRSIPDPRTALVAYLAGRHQTASVALLITREDARAVSLPTLAALVPTTQRLLAAVEGGRPIDAPARALGSALLDPLHPLLEAQRIERLVMVPDDVLHLLPFELLQLAGGRSVLDRYEISYMPSLTIAGRRWRSESGISPGAIVAVGDPRGATPRDGGWAPLPGARREVDAMTKRMGQVSARVGSAAREAFVKQAATSPVRLLHVAAHGTVDAWDARSAALVLSEGDGDDGLLYAGEIGALSLPNALVVLSACQTNSGELVAGEGVMGLTMAFLQAGARTVVTSSWRIPDRDIVPLIDDFYAGLASGRSVGAALRAAQLASRTRGARPGIWAAFRIVGDASLRVSARRE